MTERATSMKIVNDYPPNYRAIVDALGEQPSAFFCYGDTIYNPSGREVPLDIEKHEEVHMKQQGDNPELWWFRYLSEPDFRFEQELEAYGTQYAIAKQAVGGGKLLEWALDNMSEAFASESYGSLISFAEARSKIRNFAKSVII